jgi:DNA invertase Pin-like site-specific DNA recombinase
MARKSRKAATVVSKNTVTVEYRYKVAVYARLSHEKEETIERGTIENQVSFIREYIGRHDDMSVVETYVDDSFSGSNFDRPGYMQMIADMKEGKFNTIVVKDLSRLGREYVQVGNLIERIFPIYGVRFIAILDGYDSLNADAGIMMPVANIANTLYAQDISKKIYSSKHTKMEQGIPVGVAPYGYKMVHGEGGIRRMVIDGEAGEVIRRIVKMFLSGEKPSQIAGILNAEGIPTPYQYKYRDNPGKLSEKPHLQWNNEMIGIIFRNPVYRGTFVSGKDTKCLYKHEMRHTVDKEEWLVFERNHDPLITEEEYEEICKLRSKPRKVKKQEENLLKGIIVCEKCGSSMKIWRNHGKDRYFVCGRKSRYGIKECDCKNVNESVAYDTVLQVIKEQMQAFLDLDVLLDQLNHSAETGRHIRRLNDKIRKSEQEIDRIVSLKSGMYEDLSTGLINEDEYRVINLEYSKKLEGLQKALKEYKQVIHDTKSPQHGMSDIKETIAKFKRKRALTKEMVDALIERVYVNDGDVEVKLKFQDSILQLQEQVEARRRWQDEI